MTAKEKRALQDDTAAFVRRVITEVYGQKASNATVKAATARVIEVLPRIKSDEHGFVATAK